MQQAFQFTYQFFEAENETARKYMYKWNQCKHCINASGWSVQER